MNRINFCLIFVVCFKISTNVLGGHEEPSVDFDQVDTSTKITFDQPISHEWSAAMGQTRNGPLTHALKMLMEFSLTIFKSSKNITNDEENVAISPFSIISVLIASFIGAQGETRSEIRNVLLKNESDEVFRDLAPEFRRLLNQTNVQQSFKKPLVSTSLHEHLEKLKISSNLQTDSTLKQINAMFIDHGHPMMVRYLQLLSQYLDYNLYSVNFTGNAEETADLIDAWVSQMTNGKIKDLIGKNMITNSTTMLLLSVVKFYEDWLHQFSVNNTKSQSFFYGSNLQNSTKIANMKQSGSHFLYGNSDKLHVEVLAIPYKDRRMHYFIFLPHNDTNLTTVEESLNAVEFMDLIQNVTRKYVQVSMPKFKLNSVVDLKPVFSNIGIKTMFSKNADFSNIDGTKDLYVSNAIHSSFIEINEKGTETIGGTAFGFQSRSAIEERPLIFNVNRPFLFAIIDRSSMSLLFMGRFVNP